MDDYQTLVNDTLDYLRSSKLEALPAGSEEWAFFSAIKNPYEGIRAVVICFAEGELPFLTQLNEAIQTRLAPSVLIDGKELEAKNGWEPLFATATLHTILISPGYEKMTHFVAQCKKRGKGIFPLHAGAMYQQNKELKVTLWKRVTQELSQ